jgi:diaminohydroxyphosphoribosylaminopyrimidine deaminase/5-amino-6-(5-phosphoribosylamino)uracil reductase
MPVSSPGVPWAEADVAWMREARALAWLGAGWTWSNPMVGAVVVAEGEVVGAAYHHRSGESHAECLALAAAGPRARGATLYVNLEPCVHEGRTPPCVEGIVRAGIARVVIPVLDPDPRVCGRAVASLVARGIRVDSGCEGASAILDNHGYYHHRLGLPPAVTLKLATSRDGMVARARGRRDRVTGAEAQIDVHRLRAVHDAVVIGAETARIDRPVLDCRLLSERVDREPAVVVFDTSLSLASEPHWPERGRDYLVVSGENAPAERERAIEARGGRVLRCATDGGGVRVEHALARLAGAGYTRILVEGGPRLFRSFLASGAWDAMWHYQASADFGPDGVAMAAHDTPLATTLGTPVDEIALGADVRRRYVNAVSWGRLLAALAARAAEAKGHDDVHGHR